MAGQSVPQEPQAITRYVAGFAFNETETVVALLLKARPAWQRGQFNGIGGHVEEGETAAAAMAREWEEETDRANPESGWERFADLCGDSFVVHFFRANTSDLSGIASLSEGEEIFLFDTRELPPNVVSNLRWLIPMASFQCRHDWPYRIEERTERGDG
jgi:8-oxo-dGTP diphosphatase